MQEYSLQLYDNFVVKPKVFVQAIQIFAFYWHLADFLMNFTQYTPSFALSIVRDAKENHEKKMAE